MHIYARVCALRGEATHTPRDEEGSFLSFHVFLSELLYKYLWWWRTCF